LWAGHC